MSNVARAGSTAVLRAFPSARSLWQLAPRNVPFTLEAFLIGTSIVVVQTFKDGLGWTAYLEVRGNRVDDTIAQIAEYCGTAAVVAPPEGGAADCRVCGGAGFLSTDPSPNTCAACKGTGKGGA